MDAQTVAIVSGAGDVACTVQTPAKVFFSMKMTIVALGEERLLVVNSANPSATAPTPFVLMETIAVAVIL